jgi:oligoendopeptidase F
MTMAFKLTKQEAEERGKIIADLIEAWAKVETVLDHFNEEISELRDEVTNEITTYNEVLTRARAFADSIANRAEEEFGEKNEKWQEGDTGGEANDWKDAWENIDLDDLEPEFPDELEIDVPTHAEDLEGLPTEAG